ncbi:MAG TPA: AAA family ATPase [Longimicrobiales bacterium]|nr:AAA family ATPase [Longimicrobiales bacterium]
MRIVRIEASAFGRLRELDTGPDPLPGLVVVQGRNEAGKSTFAELLSVLLYGFYPAGRETFLYTPWDGTPAQGTGHLVLEDGTRAEIRRRLLSTPQGTLTVGSREEEIRNATVPWAEHVPRPVFRHVFALTLAEIAGLEGPGWEAVQDRLLGTMGASDLRSARQVVEELRSESGALWRPNRRGSQEIRSLQERVRELRRRRHEAVESEARIRDLSVRREELAEALARARAEREGARTRVARFDDLLPVRQRLLRIRELRQEAGPARDLDGLPPTPRARRDELRRRSQEEDGRLREIEVAREEPCRTVEAFGDADRAVLERAEEIRGFEAACAAADPLRVRATQLEQEILDRGDRVEAGLRILLGRELVEGDIPDLLRVSVSRVEVALRSRDEARSRIRDLSGPLPGSPGRGDNTPPWLAPVLVAVGLAALLGGWLEGSGVAVGAGVAALALGAWELVRRRRPSESDGADAGARTAALASARDQASRAEAALREALLPLEPHADAPDPGPDLPARLERLQELAREAAGRAESLASTSSELALLDERAAELGPLLGDDHRHAAPAAAAHLLTGALLEAVQRRDAARAASRELERLDGERVRVRATLDALRAESDALEAHLGRLADGDPDRGLVVAEDRMEARESARRLQAELERDQPDLEGVRHRIARAEEAGEDWVSDPDAVARARARIQGLSEEIEELTRSVQSVEKDLQHLSERTRLDEIDGEIQAAEEEVDRRTRRRDRLWILGRVVQEAEKRLREEHQPAILREAASILSELTAGRYDRIVLAGRDGRRFRVRGPGTPGSLPVEAPLSTGTREQVYLALRLAILDQLDRAGERLPLFLDEVLVNWDPVRRDAGLQTLARRSADRQCFVFTCHPGMADRLVELGAARIRLPEP